MDSTLKVLFRKRGATCNPQIPVSVARVWPKPMSAFLSKTDIHKHRFRLSLNVCFRHKRTLPI